MRKQQTDKQPKKNKSKELVNDGKKWLIINTIIIYIQVLLLLLLLLILWTKLQVLLP